VARPLTSQEPYCKSLSACSYPFKTVSEASSTALGATVGLAWLSSFSVLDFGTSTGSLRTGIRTVFSRRNLYIHFSLIDYITPRAGDIHDGVTTSFFFMYKCRCVNWINKPQLQKSVLHSSSSITDHVKRLSGRSIDTRCPEPDHPYSLRIRSRSTRAPSLNPAFLGTILKNLWPSWAAKDRRRDGYNGFILNLVLWIYTKYYVLAFRVASYCNVLIETSDRLRFRL
jgi:hypothetical protein